MTWLVLNDLKWVREYINISNGIHIIQEWDWSIGDANFVAYINVCLSGLGIWILKSALGFYSLMPNNLPSELLNRETGSLGAACSLQCLQCINQPGLQFLPQKLP
jgi:hypothetical protein